jgi:hypothetical protein
LLGLDQGIKQHQLAAFCRGKSAKTAVATLETRQTALDSISNRLQTAEAKTNAIGLCQKVFHADGEFAQVEQTVFLEIKRAFGWPV